MFMTLTEAYIYWSAEPIPPNSVNISNGHYYLYPRQGQPHEARAIQASAYGLMVYLLNNKYQESIPIMKFLQTQRNTDGGFASTQVL